MEFLSIIKGLRPKRIQQGRCIIVRQRDESRRARGTVNLTRGVLATGEASHKEAYGEGPSHYRVLAHVGLPGQDTTLIFVGS